MRQKALLFGAAGAVLLMAAGCSRDSMPVPGAGTGRDIVFTVGGENSVEVKSVEASEAVSLDPLTLTSEDGTRSLTFERSVSRSSDAGVIEGLCATATKGAEVNGKNINDIYGNKLYASALKANDGSFFMKNELLKYQKHIGETSRSLWKTEKLYVWPTNQLVFWSWSDDGHMTDISVTKTAMTFSYITPDSSGAGTDAEVQNDVIVANNKGASMTAGMGSTDSGVELLFAHALSAIRFEIGKTNGCTVKSISLKNVMSQGICTFNPAGNPRIAWSGLGTPKTFTQTFGTGINECLIDDDAHIQKVDTTPNLVKTFMVIPQSSTASKKIAVELVVRLNGASKDITFSAELSPSDAIWEAGRTYTYILSNVGDTLEIEVDDKLSGNVKSNLVIKNSTKSMVKCYIRATIVGNWFSDANTIVGKWALTDGTFSPSLPTSAAPVNNWMLGNDGYYYYKYPVHPGRETGIKNDGSGSADKLFTTYTAPAGKSGYLNIDILAQGVKWDATKSLVSSAWSSSAGTNVINFLSATDKP